jgi:hypothetical protein
MTGSVLKTIVFEVTRGDEVTEEPIPPIQLEKKQSGDSVL